MSAGDTHRGAQLIELAGYVNELTRPLHHRTAYDLYNTRTHRREQHHHHTEQPSLLQQLREGLVPTPDPDDSGGLGNSYESRPPLNPDALDCLMRIEAWSARWLTVAFRAKLRPTVEDNLHALVGEAGPLEGDQLQMLLSDVRSWHTWAQTVTAWRIPPWRPHASCPVCEKRGGLRVKLDESTAVCVVCGATWDRANVGLLADHIRQAGEDGGRVDLTRTAGCG